MSVLQWAWQAAHHRLVAASVDLTPQILVKLLGSLGGTTRCPSG